MIFRNSNDHCRKTNLSELFNEQLNTAINNMFLHSFLHIVSASLHSSELFSLNPQHISHNGLIRFPECHPNQSLRHSNQGSCQALKPIQRMQSVCKTLHATVFYLWTLRIRYQLSKANTILKTCTELSLIFYFFLTYLFLYHNKTTMIGNTFLLDGNLIFLLLWVNVTFVDEVYKAG